jgi:hypothetical protein
MQPEEKDLRRRTKEFALQIIRVFSELPKTTEAQVLGKQVLRSGTSVGANYREAYRARSRAEFIAKCGDSLRELEERSVLGGRDIDGQIRAGSGRADGEQRIKRPTGSNCSLMERSFRQTSSPLSGRNATNLLPFLSRF